MKTTSFLIGVALATNYSSSFSQWAPVGVSFDFEVKALAFFDDTLYAGGEFGVAKFNNSWQKVGNHPTYVLATFAGKLYAGGDSGLFELTNGWLPVGDIAGKVFCLTSYQGNLYVGGDFPNFIARFDGTNWQNCGAGVNGPVYALTVYASELYAAGPQVAKWNGTHWSAAGNLNFIVRSLVDYYAKGKLVAGGANGELVQWDGHNWSEEIYLDGSINCFYPWLGDLILGGSFTEKIVVWNENGFTPIGSLPGKVNALVQKDDILYAASQFNVVKFYLSNLATSEISPKDPEITIWPNPFETEAKVVSAPENLEMTIYNSFGSEVKKLNFFGRTTLQGLNPGVYFYKIVGKGLNTKGKFVIE